MRRRIKASGTQWDDRVVEVHWDFDAQRWRFMRFRDDKPNGNHKSVVEAIIKSIAEGVEKDAVRPPPLPVLCAVTDACARSSSRAAMHASATLCSKPSKSRAGVMLW